MEVLEQRLNKMAENNIELRKDGMLPVIYIEAENLAEATHKAILNCYFFGTRVETPKHKEGGSLGYDADMIIKVHNPDSEPKICYPGIWENARGIVQYILEVTHGIHNHWKKDPNDPNDKRWGYTYNERFVDQLPFVFQRIKNDWDTRKRITGRDYQFTTWRAGEDIILEQDDPPCLQRGHLRFLQNNKGEIVLNYITDWRSRDLLKAWNENNIAQIELQKLFAAKISDLLGIPIRLGAYIDHSSSLHLYGAYIDDTSNLNAKIKRMIPDIEKESIRDIILGKKNKKDFENNFLTIMQKLSMGLDDYFINETGKDKKGLMRIVAAQSDAEAKGYGTNIPEQQLVELKYDLKNFKYPEEWDSWPKSWDAEPDKTKLARVL